jgi:hypothetical protein
MQARSPLTSGQRLTLQGEHTESVNSKFAVCFDVPVHLEAIQRFPQAGETFSRRASVKLESHKTMLCSVLLACT